MTEQTGLSRDKVAGTHMDCARAPRAAKRPVFMIEIAGAGGICHYTYSLMRHLGRQVAPVLYTGCPYEPAKSGARFPYHCTFRRFRTNPLRVLRLGWEAACRRPVVHVQLSQHPAFVLPLVLMFKLLRLRLVITAHNVVSHERRAWETPVFWLLYRLADKIVVHSRYSKGELLRAFRQPEAKVRVIDHGNYMFFGRVAASSTPKRGAREGAFRVLFFGYIREYKGLDVLLEALASPILARRRIVLDVVGRPQEPFKRYQAFIESLELQDRVALHLEYVPLEHVASFFEAASVVVLPYRHVDQSGVVQLAYGLGKPVIVTAVGGLPEVVEEGRSGFVVPAGDSRRLAERLRDLVDDPELGAGMGRRANELAQTRFSWQRIAEENEALYLCNR